MPEIVEKGFAEKQKGTGVPNHSSIPMSPSLSGTYRFGEVSPFFYMEGVPDDVIELQCKHGLRTYTLKAPLMSDISMNRNLFQIPFEAILPRTWELIYKQPKIGDDAPKYANCLYKLMCYGVNFLRGLLNGCSAAATDNDPSTAFSFYFYAVNTCQLFFSRGSLFSAFGCNLWPRLSLIDGVIESTLSDVSSALEADSGNYLKFVKGLDELYVVHDVNSWVVSGENRAISLRQMLAICYDDPEWVCSSARISGSTLAALVTKLLVPLADVTDKLDEADVYEEEDLNVSNILAYQLVCAHFFSNDTVDYIYSASLYRSYIGSLVKELSTDPSEDVSFFTYNGESIQYDYLSGYVFNQIAAGLSDYGTGFLTLAAAQPYYAYAYALFGFRRSMRFMDYFTGGRTRPLAVGDISVDTSGTSVSALEISRGITKARFYNAVNRIKSGIEGYIEGIFGIRPQKDFHNPLWLADMKDTVFGDEVQNTGTNQLKDSNSITTNLRSTGSNYAFRIQVDRPSILLGLVWFDLPRSYSKGIDKFWLHEDRFDMFNPYMQYLGDQVIDHRELNSAANLTPVWAYTNRHQEYKTIPNRAFGGFVSDALPGWEFIADDSYQDTQMVPLSPEYIRSRASELDEFYVALSGYSLANYFHFAIKFTNFISSKRPMTVAPNIL